MENLSEDTIFFIPSIGDDALLDKGEWIRKVWQNTQEIDQIGAGLRDNKTEINNLKAAVSSLLENRKLTVWKRPLPSQSTIAFCPIEIPLNIRTTFEKLEEDFDSISRRIVWCDELKEYLSSFEDELGDHNVKYLSWFVSTLRDIFAYNYAEHLTYEQLMVIKQGLEIIYEKHIRCDKEAFEKYYSMLVVSGLSLLPTSSKAINEFGE